LLDKQLVYDVLTAALATGGDLAEIFMENTVKDNITMTNGLIEKASWGMEYGLGLRIILGTGAVYAYTNNTSRDSLLKLASEAAQAVKVSLKDDPTIKSVITLDRREWQRFSDEVKMPVDKVAKSDIAAKLRLASEAAYAYDPLITQTSGGFLSVVQDVLIANLLLVALGGNGLHNSTGACAAVLCPYAIGVDY